MTLLDDGEEMWATRTAASTRAYTHCVGEFRVSEIKAGTLRTPSLTPVLRNAATSSERPPEARSLGLFTSVTRLVNLIRSRLGAAPNGTVRVPNWTSIVVTRPLNELTRRTVLRRDVLRPDDEIDQVFRQWMMSLPPTMLAALPLSERVSDEVYAQDWGITSPRRSEVSAALLWHLREGVSRRQAVLQAALEPKIVSELTGLRLSELDELVRKDEIVSLEHGGERWFPAWQFHPGASRTLLPIKSLVRAFHGDAVALSLWMENPNDRLQGQAPYRLLAKGDIDSLVDLMETSSIDMW